MGTSASFYLISGELLADLHAAAAPRLREVKEKGLFFSRTRTVNEDALRPFLRANAKRCSDFSASGYAFSSLDRLLVQKGLATLFANVRLARPQVSIGYFDDRIAASVLSQLRALRPTEEEVVRFLRAQASASAEEASEATEVIFAAIRSLQEWLALVEPGLVGVLNLVQDVSKV